MTEQELKQRVALMSGRELIFSNQYGMLFILNSDNEILLNVTSLVNKDTETMRLDGRISALESWASTIAHQP